MYVLMTANHYQVGDRPAWSTPEEAWDYGVRRDIIGNAGDGHYVARLVPLIPTTKVVTTFEENA